MLNWLFDFSSLEIEFSTFNGVTLFPPRYSLTKGGHGGKGDAFLEVHVCMYTFWRVMVYEHSNI